MKTLITFVICIFLTACDNALPDIDWSKQDNCQLKLVAYKTSKASYYWMEESKTGVIFKFNSLGGRRIPTIPLGSFIESKCGFIGDRFVTEFQKYRTSIVVNPNTGRTEIKTLSGYEWVI